MTDLAKMENGERGKGNGEWEMGNGKWEMGNGKWEITMRGKSGQRCFGSRATTLDFFGDGGIWASVAIGQLYIQGESILLVFLFVLNHGKDLMEKPLFTKVTLWMQTRISSCP